MLTMLFSYCARLLHTDSSRATKCCQQQNQLPVTVWNHGPVPIHVRGMQFVCQHQIFHASETVMLFADD